MSFPLTEDQFIGGRAAWSFDMAGIFKNQEVDVTNYALDLEGDFIRC